MNCSLAPHHTASLRSVVDGSNESHNSVVGARCWCLAMTTRMGKHDMMNTWCYALILKINSMREFVHKPAELFSSKTRGAAPWDGRKKWDFALDSRISQESYPMPRQDLSSFAQTSAERSDRQAAGVLRSAKYLHSITFSRYFYCAQCQTRFFYYLWSIVAKRRVLTHQAKHSYFNIDRMERSKCVKME